MNIELYEQKINMLYDYLNNEDFQDNYEIGKIDINKINLTDIELPEGKNSNEILEYLLKQNLQYLFTINDDIYFKVLSNNFSTLMKISLNKEKAILNDNFISYVLSELVLQRKTNNILLPIVNFNVNLLDLKKLLKLGQISEQEFNSKKETILKKKIETEIKLTEEYKLLEKTKNTGLITEEEFKLKLNNLIDKKYRESL